MDVDLLDRRGRLIRLIIAIAVGAAVTIVVMRAIASVSIEPNRDPVGGSSVALLSIFVFVLSSVAALAAVTAIARRVRR